MGSRASLNKVLLIGNLTRDPELRYTPSGAAVCTFSVATNRFYVASDGTKKEEAEFTRIVAWNKLAELCSQLLTKGRKVYVEGRLQTRSWETPDGQTRQTTEVVIDDMRILDPRRDFAEAGEEEVRSQAPEVVPSLEPLPKVEETAEKSAEPTRANTKKGASSAKAPKEETVTKKEDEVDLEDLPF